MQFGSDILLGDNRYGARHPTVNHLVGHILITSLGKEPPIAVIGKLALEIGSGFPD